MSAVRSQKKIENLEAGLAQLIRSLPAPLTLSGLPTYVAASQPALFTEIASDLKK